MFILFFILNFLSQSFFSGENTNYDDGSNSLWAYQSEETNNNSLLTPPEENYINLDNQNISNDLFSANLYNENQNKYYENVIIPEFEIDEKKLTYDDTSGINTFFNKDVYYDDNNFTDKNQKFLDLFKNFCNELKLKTKIDIYNMFIDLSRDLSNEKNPILANEKMKKIFNKYLLGKNLKTLLKMITENTILNIFVGKKKEPKTKEEYIFKQNPCCSISIDKDKISSINIIGDVHASYDVFGLLYNFFLNSKNGDYLIFVGDYVDKDYSPELYSSIFCFLISSIVNSFFISQEKEIYKLFGENYPTIIFNRGNHETLNFVRHQLLDILIKYNLLDSNSIESTYEEYVKEVYFYETVVNIKNYSTFVIGHSIMLELFNIPVDCNKFLNNEIKFYYKNVLNTKDIDNHKMIKSYKKNFKEKQEYNDFKSIINCQKRFYLRFFRNPEWRSSARLLGEPSYENYFVAADDIFFELKNAKNIFNLNYKNTEPIKFIAFGHAHFSNVFSLYKLCKTKNFCALPLDENLYKTEARFGEKNFLNLNNKTYFVFKNGTSLKELINKKNIFALFLPPLNMNGYGRWISKELNINYENISSYAYRIKNNFNNELCVESIKIKTMFQ